MLLITGIYPPDSGGPARFSEDFARWLISKKIAVQVITYSDLIDSTYSSASITVKRIKRRLYIPVKIIKFVREIGSLIDKNQGVLVVGSFIETYLASIIYGFNYTVKVPGDIVWERARNNSYTNLNIDQFQSQRLNAKYRCYRILYSKSLRHANSVIVPSLGLYKLCVNWGVSHSKLKLIYNSVEVNIITKNNLRQKIYDIVTVCRLVSWKGVDELILYVGEKKLRMLVIGDGPEKSRLKSLAEFLHADVTFVGNISSRRVLEFVSNSKVFVLNSYYEGLPHALIEARAVGTLSVARHGTGAAEVINDDEDGFLIRPDRSLEETLELALSTHPDTETFVAKAQADCLNRFNKSTNFSQILNLF